MVINSPPGLTEYFASRNCQNRVYAIFDDLVIVGWHLTYEEAVKASNGLNVEIIYKSLS